MSKQFHTPGPWQVSGVRTKIGGEPVLNVGPDGTYIAMVLYGDGSMEQHRTAHADANLVAAAPDLLEALEFALEHVVVGGKAFRKMSAAIAKASPK